MRLTGRGVYSLVGVGTLVALSVACNAADSKSMRAMHSVPDTLHLNAAEAIAPEVTVQLVFNAAWRKYVLTFDVSNGAGASNAIALFAVEPFRRPYGTQDPDEWWGFYGFDGRDSVVAWACVDTTTPVPGDWTQRGVTPFMLAPGAPAKRFVLVPENVPPVVRMYAQGLEPYRHPGEPERTIFEYGWIGEVALNVTGAGPEARPKLLELRRPQPNPSSGPVSIGFELPTASSVRLSIHDVAGAQVRTLVDGSRSHGAHIVTWDGRDNGGRVRPAGVYFARLVVDGRQVGSRRIVVAR